jgi:hypothetical protein
MFEATITGMKMTGSEQSNLDRFASPPSSSLLSYCVVLVFYSLHILSTIG